MGGQALPGLPRQKAEEQWAKTTQSIAKPHFPDKVLYPQWCQSLCRQRTTQRILKLQARMLSAWTRMISSVAPEGKAAQAASLGLLFACKVGQ